MGANCPACDGKRSIVPVGNSRERYVCLKCNLFYQMYEDKNAIIRIAGNAFSSLKEFREYTQKAQK